MATSTQKPTQDYRKVAVGTPLGKDVLLFGRMTAHERLGRLFQFDLELFSEDCDLKLTDVLGQAMGVRLELPGERGTRYFHGYVTDFRYRGMNRLRYGVYHATLRPWLWFLTRTADCRIFQNQKVPDLIKGIFAEHGFTDYDDKGLSGNYRQWEYCVQYRETDFNFISRLMEQEGIYYYFKHEQGKHILMLADGYGAHQKFKGYEQVPYFPPDVHDHRERDHLSELRLQVSHQPGAYALNEFDFKTPGKKLLAKLANPKDHARAQFEIYDYPGEYLEYGEGETYTRLRLEELLAQHESVAAQGNAAGLAVGHLFNLTGCPRQDLNREYLIESATHQVESDAYESVAGSRGAGKLYQGEYVLLDAKQPYRAPRTTPKPVVQGPQTATVVGKAGEEIWTDEYGRVKVQFHWDREGQRNENSSCWIRVSQVWAGKQWGAIHIPRIGQEVIVDFLEGDPDQPIITGRVYNGANMPPYTLPANQTQSGIKSRSSKGGGPDNFNEIRFEDKKGQEEVYIHAERNLKTVVEASESRSVGGSRTTTIQKDETLTIKEGNRTETLEKGNDTLTLKQGNRTTTLDKGNDTLKATLGNITIEAPAGKYSVSAKDVEITGTTSVKIVCGGSSIEMTPAKITMNSPTIEINGTALTTIKGGLVKINC